MVSTLLLLANFVASIPAFYDLLRTPCALPNHLPCTLPGQETFASGQLTPDEILLLARFHLSIDQYAAITVALNVAVSLMYWGVGLLIFWRKSDKGIGLFVSLLLILFGSTGPSDYFLGTWVPSQPPQSLQVLLFLISVTQWAALVAFLLTFPTGRFVPGWSWLFIPINFILDVPLPVSAEWMSVITAGGLLLSFGSTFWIMVYRYRNVFDQVQRQQTKWLLYSGAITLLLGIIFALLPLIVPANSPYQLLTEPITVLSFIFVPLGVGIAILRYRLWDIDNIINRTLVYGTLSTSIVIFYILIVSVLGSFFEVQGNLVLSLLATCLVAVLFQPLRLRLQQTVNRLMYGERDDPYQVISHLGKRLEGIVMPDMVLPTIVETVAQALKLPYAAITLQQNGERAVSASYGKSAGGGELRLPLSYQAEQIGELILAPRSPGEVFSLADRRLLEDLPARWI